MGVYLDDSGVERRALAGVGVGGRFEALLEQRPGGLVVASRQRDQAQALRRPRTPARIGADLRLLEHAFEQLGRLVQMPLADQHRRFQRLQRLRPLLGRGLAGELLGADVQATGDLVQHPWAGTAVAGFDPRQIAVGAAVERQVALGHRALATVVPDPSAEFSQRLVGVLGAMLLLLIHRHLPPGFGGQRRRYAGRILTSLPFLAPGVKHGTTLWQWPFPPLACDACGAVPVFAHLVRETRLDVADLIQPLFLREGDGAPVEIPSLPGQHNHAAEAAGRAAARPVCARRSRQ